MNSNNMTNGAIFEPVHITTKHTGKMSGMQSISTSCTNNPHCNMYRAKCNGGVCRDCYAVAQLNRYKNNVPIFEKNGDILSGHILEPYERPRINAVYFRFESFGDLINDTHFINYCNIAADNPRVNFTLWTKNGNIINNYVKAGGSIPDNLQIILSSFKVNQRTTFKFDTFKYKVFTVYSDEKAAKDAGAVINCGARNCSTCLKCYEHNNIKYINELLK